MPWLDGKVNFGEELEEGVSDKYIFYEMPRKCVVTWELILYRSGLALITGAVYFISEGTSAIYPSMRRDKYLGRNRPLRLSPNLSTWLMYHILKGKKKVITLPQNYMNFLNLSIIFLSLPRPPPPAHLPSSIL